MHALGLIQTEGGGIPKINREETPYHGHIFIGEFAGWGAYLISGTGPQLAAINALPEAVGIAVMTTTEEGRKWQELDSTASDAVRTKINTWLTNHGLQTIPANWDNRRVVKELFTRLNPKFNLEFEWVTDT